MNDINLQRSNEVPLVIRDDVWALVAGCLLAIGGELIILGFISTVRSAAAMIGLACGLGASWILGRPVGLVIDRRIRIVISRGLIRTRQLAFAEITAIEISPSQPALAAPNFPIEMEGRFDVVLVARTVERAVRRDLDEGAAYREAKRIRSILGIGS